uniref:Uncharacterized protein n=1 Tax=Panagrolaimus sp. JU765 TaxID=591449 RepID=A0AC34QZ07_9BILA
MDFGTALSSLIKPQCQFPDPAAILALANLKYPLNYGLPNYGHSLLQTRQQGGMPPIDITEFSVGQFLVFKQSEPVNAEFASSGQNHDTHDGRFQKEAERDTNAKTASTDSRRKKG